MATERGRQDSGGPGLLARGPRRPGLGTLSRPRRLCVAVLLYNAKLGAARLEWPRKTLYYQDLFATLVRWRLTTSFPSCLPGSPEEALARQVDFDRLPQHIAVIMDGNGRWAAQRHLPRVEGHRAGIDSVREVVEGSARLGIEVLTLYAFSVENWKRPATEVSTLMTLLKRYLRLELNTLLRNNIRFQRHRPRRGAGPRRPRRS